MYLSRQNIVIFGLIVNPITLLIGILRNFFNYRFIASIIFSKNIYSLHDLRKKNCTVKINLILKIHIIYHS